MHFYFIFIFLFCNFLVANLPNLWNQDILKNDIGLIFISSYLFIYCKILRLKNILDLLTTYIVHANYIQ